MKPRLLFILTCCLVFSAGTIVPQPQAPGIENKGNTKVAEADDELLQKETPLRSIHSNVCGFNFYSADMSRQLIVNHYYFHLSKDVLQYVNYAPGKKVKRADFTDAHQKVE